MHICEEKKKQMRFGLSSRLIIGELFIFLNSAGAGIYRQSPPATFFLGEWASTKQH